MKKFLLVLSLFIFIQSGFTQFTWSTRFINIGALPHYDFVSYSSANSISEVIDGKINLAFMSAPAGQPVNYPGLNVKYFYTEDTGNTWIDLGFINALKNGHPFVRSIPNEGSLELSLTNAVPSTGAFNKMSVLYDVCPACTSYTYTYPPNRNLIYAKSVATTQSTYHTIVAQSPTSDSIYTCRYNMNSSQGTDWQYIGRAPKEAFIIARGSTKTGIAFIGNSDNQSDNKCVYLIESTNEGVNFSAPLKIYQSDVSGGGFAAHRGISMVYQNDNALITFDAAKYNSASDSYDIKAPAKIMFWCAGLAGIDPNKSIAIADSTKIPIPPKDSIKTGTDDEYPVLSRPVMGTIDIYPFSFIVFQAVTQHWGGTPPDTANYKALYVVIDLWNLYFLNPIKVTPENPLRDWSYPGISPSFNWQSSVSPGELVIDLCALCDSIPGTRVITGSNTNCNPYMYFIRAKYLVPAVKKLGDLIPASFILQQNYPNPFNPSTKIKFAVPNVHNESVSIKIYDALGKELETLVDKVISQGWYEVDFDGSRYPSGVYFYKLQCGSYTETKKMILVK
ncbi:MAG TPA: T9SS type A sorting domain-containing protein [Ignavibacteria bacterium]|nr:T9SS type A sorting domain-containing protein [Ignavibacteria bacterium]